jgi:hypothetical protein
MRPSTFEDNARVCVECFHPFTASRRPWESRRLRDYDPGHHVEARVEAWGHVCKPCATRESQDATNTSRTTP